MWRAAYVPLGAPTSAGTNERPMLRVRRSHVAWQVRPRLLRRAAGTLLNLSPDLGFLHGGLGSGYCSYFFAWPELGRKWTKLDEHLNLHPAVIVERGEKNRVLYKRRPVVQ